jgi:hypothetical protein
MMILKCAAVLKRPDHCELLRHGLLQEGLPYEPVGTLRPAKSGPGRWLYLQTLTSADRRPGLKDERDQSRDKSVFVTLTKQSLACAAASVVHPPEKRFPGKGR